MSGWIFGGWPPPPPGAGGAVDIGDPVGGGSANSVLFIDAAGKLAQDPGRFSYDKVLKRQTLGAGTSLRFTPSTADGDAHKVFLDVLPAPDGLSQSKAFQFVHLRALFGATYDHSVAIGWNPPQSPDYDATKGSVYFLLEDNFDSSGGAGPILDEGHIVFRKPGGGDVRAWTGTVNWTTGEMRVAQFADVNDFLLPDNTALVLVDTTGLTIRKNRKIFLTDSAPTIQPVLGFNLNTLEFGNAAYTTHYLSPNNTFDGDASFGQDGGPTHTIRVDGGGHHVRLQVSAGSAQLLSNDQHWLVSADDGATYPLQVQAGAVVVDGTFYLANAGAGLFPAWTTSAADAAGGADGDVHLRVAGANTKLQLNVNGAWKTVTVV